MAASAKDGLMLRTRCWIVFGAVAAVLSGAATKAPGGLPPDVRSSAGKSSPATSRPVVQRLLGILGAGARTPTTAPAPAAAMPSDDTVGDPPRGPDPDIRVSTRGTVEMHVTNEDLRTVIQLLGQQSRRNIIASPQITGVVTADLYDVTVDEALDAILAANGCTAVPRRDCILVLRNEDLDQKNNKRYSFVPKVFPLRYVDPQEAIDALTPIVGADAIRVTKSEQQTSSSTNSNQSATDNKSIDITVNSTARGYQASLLVYAPEEKLREVEAVLAQIDKRPKQVLVEATILRAQLNEDNALGIDFNILCGVDFKDLSASSPGLGSVQTGDLSQAKISDSNTKMAFRTDFNSAVPQGGFTFGILTDSVAVFLRALEQVTDTTVIANPKVLAISGQPAGILVGRRDGYRTTTVTETTTTETVKFLDTGTLLVFRAYVGDDDYIRMSIHPKDSTGGLTASNLPFEQATEVLTDIGVRDGYTVLIGGLFREVTTAAKAQMPYLGNLPVAGMLFRNSRDTTQREEVIILLTVHIVKDDDAFVEASRKLAEDVERYRVGMREGLQQFGRERLAQAHYHWAIEHLERGDEGRALWDARIAAYLNPTFLAAIELVEKLTNKRAWDDDGSAVRDFVVREIQREKGIHAPLYGRPGPPFTIPEHLNGPSGFEGPEEGEPGGPDSRRGESEGRS
jgi:type IV pilus assembly protein PilQ